MLEFLWPWVFALAPLPFLLRKILPAKQDSSAALKVPFYQQLAQSQESKHTPLWQILLLSIIWLCLLVACARPIWIGDPVELPASGRDLLLAVDISGSMKTADMNIDGEQVPRLWAVKSVVGDFVERRKHDRLGLVLFGTQAYLQAPLTFDRATVKQLLDEAQLGFAGEKTAIGDAIGLAIKRLRERPADSRVLILLTDGANTAGEVAPLQAAELAKQTHVKIYTIGVGADQMTTPGIFGSSFGSRTINPSLDLDEESLQKIAQLTGGRYFRARNPEDLQKIYALLDELEPIEQAEETFRPRKSFTHWPLGIALALIALFLLGNIIVNLFARSNASSTEEVR
ncbi:vWA domain-containing protein [Pseudoteredinibacter isoporae]|uniref:Ca-activated chloride channel family protein n=1 Tax=Pseudoteredinibacter isoporae TaxID=570281 RepID=A0A7X0JUF7_9GAMM|nr:VWA domain-containing protein [Pseudoteredinibacter isoporae]MBB6521635.1 Ca-activated chloride channel family protein [Pseudoteredinibacter isoporae]NHO87189.1 VWA domain-containing protein [Pseudoteredinibacter isoporae]NIB23013.1 VWA domain-containing protein [Pseudoteredinibacter isoporae]